MPVTGCPVNAYLKSLQEANIIGVGAGKSVEEAQAPAVVEIKDKGRVIIFSFGSPTSGIPPSWAASKDQPGVCLIDLSDTSVRSIQGKVKEVKRQGDVVVASIHWGGNWGYRIPSDQIEFAHNLIDHAQVDVVYGHSSHHVKGIEIYRGKPVIYGCGDFLNDYEGIGGHEDLRSDLGLMYFVSMDPASGRLAHLLMTPTRVRRFRVQRASGAEALWLRDILRREGIQFGTSPNLDHDNRLTLQ